MDAVVKIDSELLKKIEEFINKKENKIIYSTKKQFIDIAVMEKLSSLGKVRANKMNKHKRGEN